jgi:hypothetical protein
MWLIRVEGEDLGNPNTNQFNNDALVANFSLFRGPNVINWYCRQTSNVLLTKLDGTKPFELIYFEQGSSSPLFTVLIKLDAINWHDKMSCFEYTFIPLAYYFLQSTVDVYIGGQTNLGAIVKEICKEASYEVKPQLDDTLTSIVYKGYHGTGKAIDLIADLCSVNGLEFGCISDWLIIGKFIGTQNTGIYSMIDNTIAHYNRVGTEYHSGRTIGQVIPPPGTTFSLNVLNAKTSAAVRNIYTSYRFTDKELRCIFVTSDKPVTEMDLIRALPSDIRSFYKYSPPKSIVQLGKIQSASNREDKVYYNKYANDKFDLKIQESSNITSVSQSSPYAGETEGIQFPTNENVNIVVVNPDERKDMAVEVAQLFQGKEPKRNNIKDFRLTLPDGGTLYYDYTNGKWILAAKQSIDIGVTNNNSTDVPTISGKKAAARAEDPTICNDQTDGKYWSWMRALKQAFSTWVPVPSDGGASFKAMLAAVISLFPDDQTGKVKEGSSKVTIG